MPTPKLLAYCDFNQDGDFTDASDEITADIRRLSIARGKNLPKHRAEAAVCEMVLNNDTHKYSPSYTGSPLYPGALPAPNVWCLAGYPVDSFDVADATTLAARKPDFDDKFAAWAGDTADFDVLTNKLRTATGANKSAVLEFGESNCWVGCQYSRGGVSAGLILRWSDASNYLLVYHDGTNLILGKVDAGTLSTIATVALTWALAAEKWVIAQVSGTRVRVIVEQALEIDTTTTFNQAATKHGVGGRATHANDRWDYFGGWRPVFYGRIDAIQPRPRPGQRYCYVRAMDDMERLSRHMVYRIAPAAPNTFKGIIGRILDAADFSTKNRLLDTGTTLTSTAGNEKVLGRDALSELYQVQDDEVGFVWINGAGIVEGEAADHRDSAPYTKSEKTWQGTRVLGDETDTYVDDLEWDDGKDRVENEIYYHYYYLSRTTVVEVWRLDNVNDRPAILNGQTIRFLAVGSGDQVANPVTPVATTDFTVNTAQDGTGTDLTATSSAALVSGFDGNFTAVEITNSSGSNGFVTLLKLRADKDVKSFRSAARSEDGTSQANNGRRRVEHQSLHIDRFTVAQGRADKRKSQRAQPRERLVVSMPNGSRDNLMQIIHRNISERVAVVWAPMGITDSFHIEAQKIEFQDGGKLVHCSWELSQALSGGWGFVRWNQYNWG